MPASSTSPFLVIAIASMALTACREGAGTGDEAKPPVPPECVAYVEEAEACLAKTDADGKKALGAVYSANKKSIEGADKPAKMEALVKQCKKWSELLAKQPKCQ